MINENHKIEKKSLEKLELSNKPILVITRELKNKIDFLHQQAGATEWSGELITREEGTISDPDKWKITAEDVYLVDIGTPAFTGYEMGKGSYKPIDIVDLYETYPELLEGTQKLQNLHTHHNMGAYFSSTDWENLEERASISNYFMMLIVNFDGKYCAKVAFKAKKEGSKGEVLRFVNNSDNLDSLVFGETNDSEVLVVMDCRIIIEETDVSEIFKQRFLKVQNNKKEEEIKKEKERKKQYSGYRAFQNSIWDWEEDNKPPKQKKISDMSEKEWGASQVNNKSSMKEATAYLNSILDDSYTLLDFSDPLPKIKKDDKKIKSIVQLEKWLETFRDNLREHFDILFPLKDDSEYILLLEEVLDYLELNQYIRLSKGMLDIVEEELEDIKGSIPTYKGGFGSTYF